MLKRILNEVLCVVVGFIVFVILSLVIYYFLHFFPLSLEIILLSIIFWIVGTLVVESIRNR